MFNTCLDMFRKLYNSYGKSYSLSNHNLFRSIIITKLWEYKSNLKNQSNQPVKFQKWLNPNVIPVFFSEKRPDRSAFSTLILVCFNAAVGKFVLLCRKRALAHCIPEQKGNRQKIDHKIEGKYAIKCVFIKRNTFITLALFHYHECRCIYISPQPKVCSVTERPGVCFLVIRLCN